MKKALVVAGLVLAAAAVFLVTNQNLSSQSGAAASPVEATVVQTSTEADGTGSVRDKATQPSDRKYRSGSVAASSARYAKDRIEVGDELWGASTQEEADWLNRNWYPTAAQLQLYNGAGMSGQLPPDGVPRSAADIVLAEKVAASHPAYRDKAVAVLENAAASGSIYALSAMARVAGGGKDSAVLSEAYYRAAVLRGDWLAGMNRNPHLSQAQSYAADIRARQILDDLNRQRASRGLGPLGSDVRRGLDKAAELIERSGVGG